MQSQDRRAAPTQAPVNREVEVRARAQEKVYFWWAVIISALFLLAIVTRYVSVNLWLLMLGVVLFVLVLFVILRQAPPPDMWDVWRKLKKREYVQSHTTLPVKPRNLQAYPYGRYLILQAFIDDESKVASYLWEVNPGRVWGRRIRKIDDIVNAMEASKVSALGAQEAIFRMERGRLLEQAGFVPEDEGGES